MSDHDVQDDVLESLPFGDPVEEQVFASPKKVVKKKKKKLVRVKKKKRKAPPPEVPEPPIDEFDEPADDPTDPAPSNWSELDDDVEDEVEEELPTSPGVIEDIAPSVPTFDSTLIPGEGPTGHAEPDPFTDDEYEQLEDTAEVPVEPLLPREPVDELATLPIPTGDDPAEAPGASVDALPPVEGQTLPSPLGVAPGLSDGLLSPITPPAEPKPVVVPGKVNKLWDEFMLALSDQTRVAVWELGADSIMWFATRAPGDLLPPRGKMTKGQLNEIEGWLNKHGVFLGDRSADSSLRRPGSSGVTIKRGGLRVQNKKAVAVVKGPQTIGQKRNARLSDGRFTM